MKISKAMNEWTKPTKRQINEKLTLNSKGCQMKTIERIIKLNVIFHSLLKNKIRIKFCESFSYVKQTKQKYNQAKFDQECGKFVIFKKKMESDGNFIGF